MSQPPTGAEGYPPQPPGGAVYGNPYGAGQPAPQQYGATQQYPAAQPEPTQQYPVAQPVPPQSAPPVPGQYAPGAAPVPAPGYPQPMSAPPVSGPGFGPQPMSAPPQSAPPVSGPGFGPQPMSAPPGPPYGAPAPAAGKGRAALILAIVAGLLFIVGGVMTGLYVTTNGELHRTEQQVSQRDGTIAANKQEIDKLKADLQTVQDKLADAEQDLTGTKNDRDEQARQKKVIGTCLNRLIQASEAAAAGNKAAFDKATKGLNKICDEAENYL